MHDTGSLRQRRGASQTGKGKGRKSREKGEGTIEFHSVRPSEDYL